MPVGFVGRVGFTGRFCVDFAAEQQDRSWPAPPVHDVSSRQQASTGLGPKVDLGTRMSARRWTAVAATLSPIPDRFRRSRPMAGNQSTIRSRPVGRFCDQSASTTASPINRPSQRKKRPAFRKVVAASSPERNTNPNRRFSPGAIGSSPSNGHPSYPTTGSPLVTQHGHPQPKCTAYFRPPASEG